MAETIEVNDTSGNGTTARVSLDLMEFIIRATNPDDLSKNDILNLYLDCKEAVQYGNMR